MVFSVLRKIVVMKMNDRSRFNQRESDLFSERAIYENFKLFKQP